MALSLNEIKSRALAFGNNWQDERRERAEKDTFWNEFFEVFGVNRRRVATFEEPAKRFGNKRGGFIDVFWKGLLLCEHKSRGENLDGAFEQATDYFEGIKDNELPRYILVSDFARLRLYDLELKTNKEIKIQELASNLELFYFIAGYKTVTIREEEPVNIQAAELMGRLHDAIYDNGYRGHKLEILLTRILFILFSEDTGIFEKYQFHDLFLNRSGKDGSQAGQLINQLFEVLNTPNNERMKSLDESLNQFPYINGGLFEELIPTVSFDSESLKRLITCSKFDWSAISPAIFGSMFQFVMNKDRRREMGAHYTEEKNILKTINPLFLDDLKRDLETLKNYKIKSQRDKLLNDYQIKLASLIFLDPACGCGNFLIITYRELRRLELETLKAIHDTQAGLSIEYFSKVRVEQFYGIEFEEFPARIGMVAMWLMDHLMNLELSSAFGEYYARIPLAKSAGIAHANALEINWLEVLEGKKPDYIIGNPPFVGSRVQTKEQKADLIRIFGKLKNSGDLDYVCC